MSSYREVLKQMDKRAKERRQAKEMRTRGNDGRELWFNCGLRIRAESGAQLVPMVVNQQARDYGQDWLLSLPVGLCEADVRRKAPKLAGALGGDIEFQRVNDLLLMRIMTKPIQSTYPFELVDRGHMGIPVPIGYGRAGMVVLDLATAPHLLVGGTPGFGKSGFLHQAAANMLHHGVLLYVIDLKRLEFAYLKDHARVVTTEPQGVELLQALCAEMERRLEYLERAGVVKIQDLETPEMPYICVVIDELAELQSDAFFEALNRLLRLCRAVGISIVCATQRPSVKVLDGDSRAMFSARLCYQVADELNSRMVLGETHPQAAYLPAIPGRGCYRFGNACQEVQTMFLPVVRARELLSAVERQPVLPAPAPESEQEILTMT